MKTHHGLYENAESAIRTAYLKLKRIDCPEKELRRAVLLHTEEREREREREKEGEDDTYFVRGHFIVFASVI